MSDIEQRVTEMLHRRSEDIRDRPDAQLPRVPDIPKNSSLSQTSRSNGNPGWRPLAVAAAVSAVAVGGLVVGLTSTRDQSISAVSDSSTTTSDTASGVGDNANQPDQTRGPSVPPTASLDQVIRDLPDVIDADSGSFVFVDPLAQTVDELVAAYLADRLPGLTVDVQRVETDDRLTLFAWSTAEGGHEAGGSVITRHGDYLPGVVLATTDGLDVSLVTRTSTRIGATLTDAFADLFAVDVTEVSGEPVPGAPNPAGFTGEEPVFGTTGATDGDSVEIDLAIGSAPVVVRAQNVGGTFLTVLEFPVESVGFVAACGTEPPLQIEVGEHLGDLQPGPDPASQSAVLDNQQVWHYPDGPATVEIRWPANPVLTARVEPDQLTQSRVAHFGSSLSIGNRGAEPSQRTGQDMIGLTDSSVGDPCSIAQISVAGETTTTEWWAGALSAQWSFGVPLDLSELDPSLGPDGPGDPEPEPDDAEQTGLLPAVPETGSCDGLPDAPPRRGSVSLQPRGTPEEALTDLLTMTNELADPPLPMDGYTAIDSGGTAISYIITGSSGPLIVINVQRTDEGWQGTSWEAAAC